jgi:hypothetical protein
LIRLTMGLVGLVLVVALARPVLAQDEVAFTLFRDEESLTVFVDGNQPVSLAGLTFEVTTLTGETERYPLDIFSAFLGLDFTELPTPICLRLEYSRTDLQPPVECLSTPDVRVLMSRQLLSRANLFWYDSAAEVFRALTVTGGEENQLCLPGEDFCDLVYMPLADVEEEATATVEASTFISLNNVDYSVIETEFNGNVLQVWFTAVNHGADKDICLFFTSSLIDSNGVSHQQSDRSDGLAAGGLDCFNVTLPYGVPTRFGLFFDTVPPSATLIPFVEVVIRGEGSVQFRSISIPFVRENDVVPLDAAPQLTTSVENIDIRVVEAVYNNGELSVWMLGANSGPDTDVCLYFTSFMIDDVGVTHRQSERSNGASRGGLDCFNVSFPSGIPIRFGLIFDTVSPSISVIPFVVAIFRDQGQAQFRNIPVPFVGSTDG